MKNLRHIILCCMLLMATAMNAQQPTIIPKPCQMEMGTGRYTMTKGSTIGCASAQLRPAAQYLGNMLSKATGYKFAVVKNGGDIRLALSNNGKPGAYTLSVDKRGVSINGDTYAGVVNGIATLRQLLPDDVESQKVVRRQWTLPCISISDAPRFGWRGMLLDCSRHFFTVDEVKKLLDVLALYKIDKFHWHLVDDQGWRIEIKKYPLLTEKGAWRTSVKYDPICEKRAVDEDADNLHVQASKMHKTADGTTVYGGFYTQKQVRDIVEYAKVRGIEVIPEIDMPGHSLCILQNYDGLSCFKETGWGKLFSTPLCPGKDKVLQFCKDVWTEVFDLFPSKYVHIGGDEVDMTNWKKCPDCQKRMRDNNLKTEPELQAWFTHYMEKFFNAHGKTMIGWDEIIEGGLSATSTVMWWRSWSANALKEAASHGNDVICTPNTQFYVDYQEDAKSIPAILAFDPYNGLTEAEKKHVLGVQANMWAEWLPSVDRMWYMAFPRMLAVAELGWSKAAQTDAAEFKQRLAAHYPRLQKMGVAYRIPDITGFCSVNAFIGKGKVELSCADPTATIRYTTDGSTPQADSKKYVGPFTVEETTDFRFRAFGPDGKKGDVVKCRYVKADDFAPAANIGGLLPGLSVGWYDYDGNDCAGIGKAPLVATYLTDGVMIPEGVKGNIGLVFMGYVEVPADGVYTFSLTSDDGSTLDIDDKRLIDNDGGHSVVEVTAQCALKKGAHKLYARYFDHNGGMLNMRIMDTKGNDVKVNYLH